MKRAIKDDEITKLRKEKEILKQFIKGEWIDCDVIQNLLDIDFGTGLHNFAFSRTAEWNPAPLNGQKITIKFKINRLKPIDNLIENLINQLINMNQETININECLAKLYALKEEINNVKI